MLELSIIGNLGADAERKNVNGRAFVVFRVAHSEKLQDGTERTTWVSVAMNGDGGRLFEFLKRGTKVFVCGRPRLRCYSSPKTHQYEAGLDLSADRVELCGSQVNESQVFEFLKADPLRATELINRLNNEPF